MNKENKIEDKIQEMKDKDNEKVYVVISPLEETISNIPFIGEVYTRRLYKKYQKIFPKYNIILK